MQIRFSSVRFEAAQLHTATAGTAGETLPNPQALQFSGSRLPRVVATLSGLGVIAASLIGIRISETGKKQDQAVEEVVLASRNIATKNPLDTQALEARFHEFTALIREKTAEPGLATPADWQVVQDATLGMAADPEGRLRLGELIREAQSIHKSGYDAELLQKFTDRWLDSIRPYAGEEAQGAVPNVREDIHQFIRKAKRHDLFMPSIMGYIIGISIAISVNYEALMRALARRPGVDATSETGQGSEDVIPGNPLE